MILPKHRLKSFVDLALEEDLGKGDRTTQALFPDLMVVEGKVVARAGGVMAGGPVAAMVFETLDSSSVVKQRVPEESRFKKGDELLWVQGEVEAVFSGERVALNILQRLCGIATMTQEYADAVKGYKARILDTRKTLPGWKILDKYAVCCGGGVNHRFGLDDGILIKDNHLAFKGIKEAVGLAKEAGPALLKIEVEVETVWQAKEALEAGADMILLDNMSVEDMGKVVAWVKGRALLEASGGVTRQSIQQIAATGVDYISVGALTHSAPALDLSMEIKGRD